MVPRVARTLAAAVLAAAFTLPAAAEPVCDPGLVGRSESPQSYRSRGDRCEGIVQLEVSGEVLRLVSLTRRFESFDPNKPDDLTIEWSAPDELSGQKVALQAYSRLSPRSFYRMDADVAADVARFPWSADLLAGLERRREDLAVFGRAELERGGRRHEVYLPLRIGQPRPGPGTGDYEVGVLPRRQLREISYSLALVGDDGRAGEPFVANRPVSYGFYPAGEVTTFSLPEPPRPGLWELRITTELHGGRPGGSLLVWFYHPGS